MGGCGFDLDYIVIIQLNLGWGIIVNFRTVPCIASAWTNIDLCFAGRCVARSPNNLEQSCGRDEVKVFWNTDMNHIKWGSIVGKESSWCDVLLWWELKTCFQKREDLQTRIYHMIYSLNIVYCLQIIAILAYIVVLKLCGHLISQIYNLMRCFGRRPMRQ